MVLFDGLEVLLGGVVEHLGADAAQVDGQLALGPGRRRLLMGQVAVAAVLALHNGLLLALHLLDVALDAHRVVGAGRLVGAHRQVVVLGQSDEVVLEVELVERAGEGGDARADDDVRDVMDGIEAGLVGAVHFALQAEPQIGLLQRLDRLVGRLAALVEHLGVAREVERVAEHAIEVDRAHVVVALQRVAVGLEELAQALLGAVLVEEAVEQTGHEHLVRVLANAFGQLVGVRVVALVPDERGREVVQADGAHTVRLERRVQALDEGLRHAYVRIGRLHPADLRQAASHHLGASLDRVVEAVRVAGGRIGALLEVHVLAVLGEAALPVDKAMRHFVVDVRRVLQSRGVDDALGRESVGARHELDPLVGGLLGAQLLLGGVVGRREDGDVVRHGVELLVAQVAAALLGPLVFDVEDADAALDALGDRVADVLGVAVALLEVGEERELIVVDQVVGLVLEGAQLGVALGGRGQFVELFELGLEVGALHLGGGGHEVVEHLAELGRIVRADPERVRPGGLQAHGVDLPAADVGSDVVAAARHRVHARHAVRRAHELVVAAGVDKLGEELAALLGQLDARLPRRVALERLDVARVKADGAEAAAAARLDQLLLSVRHRHQVVAVRDRRRQTRAQVLARDVRYVLGILVDAAHEDVARVLPALAFAALRVAHEASELLGHYGLELALTDGLHLAVGVRHLSTATRRRLEPRAHVVPAHLECGQILHHVVDRHRSVAAQVAVHVLDGHAHIVAQARFGARVGAAILHGDVEEVVCAHLAAHAAIAVFLIRLAGQLGHEELLDWLDHGRMRHPGTIVTVRDLIKVAKTKMSHIFKTEEKSQNILIK